MKQKKVIAIIQARMGSTRLPGKVLKKIGSKSLLEILVNRIKQSKSIDAILIATTKQKKDKKIVNLAEKLKLNYFQGSEENVLDRFYNAARKINADIIVRITADNPLTDIDLIDCQVRFLRDKNYDYVTTKGVILGLGSEIFRFDVLKTAWENAKEKYQKEHITPYIYENPEVFRLGHITPPEYLKRNDIRLTIDTKQDFQLFQKLYTHFKDLIHIQGKDIVKFLDKNPAIKAVNQEIKQKCYRDITTKIAIITDGGLEMGMGHIYRTITLARELKNDAMIFFLTKSNKRVIDKIKKSEFRVLKLKNDDEIINYLKKINPNTVIIDRLKVEENFAKKLRDKLDARLIIYGNISAANKYAHIVVNAIVGSNFKNRKILDKNTNTLYFYGPKYWNLRKEFYEFRKKRKKPNNEIKKILLLFGGSDPLNLITRVTDKLLSLDKSFKIDILLGAGFIYFDKLKKVLKNYPDKKKNVKVYKDAENVAEFMYKANLVITSPGLSMFEAFCVETPVIAILQGPLHKNEFSRFINTYNQDRIENLEDIIFNKKILHQNDEYIKKLKVGEGKTEIIKLIQKLSTN